jgi:hypothetical protein
MMIIISSFFILGYLQSKQIQQLSISFFFLSFFSVFYECIYAYIHTRVRQLQQQTIKYSNEFFFLSQAYDRNDWLDILSCAPIEMTIISNGIALVENEREKSPLFLCCVLLTKALAYLTRLAKRRKRET